MKKKLQKPTCTLCPLRERREKRGVEEKRRRKKNVKKRVPVTTGKIRYIGCLKRQIRPAIVFSPLWIHGLC